MVDKTWTKKITDRIKKSEGEFCSQEELRLIFGNIDRRTISGYLQCMVDLGEICFKNLGKVKVYFISKEVKKK